MRFTSRSFLICAVVAMGLGGLRAADPKPGDDVGPGDVRLPFGLYSVVFYYTPFPKADPKTTAQALVAKYFPDLPFVTNPTQDPPLVGFDEELAPLTNYPVPDPPYLGFAGRGLTADEITGIQKTARATFILLAVPKDRVWKEGRKFTEFALEFAETTGALLWDSATRECFSRGAWKKERLENWLDGQVPEIRDQVTVHLYRPDDQTSYLRAVTLGMEKFALPDVVIERLIGSDSRPAGNLINLVCQTLAEKPVLQSGKKEVFSLAALKAGNFREAMTSSLEKDATGGISVKLVHGRPDDGDPDNDLLEIRFDHGAGQTDDERRNDLLSKLWGASDAIVKIKHTDEILQASQQARARLLEIKPEYDKGLPPGARLLVKVPFSRDDEGNEWMWVEVMKWPSNSKIEGVLQNDPFFIARLKAGARVDVKVSEVFDYILRRADGTSEGNETGRLMEKQGGEVREK